MTVENGGRVAGTVHSLALLLAGGVEMQRDDDLARSLIQEIEAEPDPIYMFGLASGASDADRVKYYHLQLLRDAGFLEETGKYGGVFRITNDGHDFLSLTRQNETWERTKSAAKRLGGVTLGLLRDIALEAVRQKARDLGLLP